MAEPTDKGRIIMYGKKLCLSLSSEFGISEEEQITLFKKIGFDGFFCMYESGKDLVRLREAADRCGMYFQSVHAPYVSMAHIWKQSEHTEAALRELLDCIDEAARAGTPIVVLHPFIGFEDHEPTPEGLARLRTVVDRAGLRGIRLAFENVEGEEYLDAVMSEFTEPFVGFCIDTGHEMCYNRSRDMLSVYGDRLFCTHLNDNLGVSSFDGSITWLDDLHLLPYDGAADWNGIADRLLRCGFEGELTFELNKFSKPDRHENDAYAKAELTEYLTEAYKRACRFALMLLRKSGTVEA